MARTSAPVRTRRASPTVDEPRRARTTATPAPKSGGRPHGRLRNDLIAIAVGLLGLLVGLALLRPGSAGIFGAFLVSFLRVWMGAVVTVSPLIFFGAALVLALDYRRATTKQLVLGVAGILVVLFGCVHLSTTARGSEFDTSYTRIVALFSRGGDPAIIEAPDAGVLGAFVMAILFPLGKTGSFATLAAIGVASTLLISELTLRGIFERMHERSRIAAEKARNAAAARRLRRREAAELAAQEAAERGPSLPVPARKPLFLDVDRKVEEKAIVPVAKPERKSMFSRRTREAAAEPDRSGMPLVKPIEPVEVVIDDNGQAAIAALLTDEGTAPTDPTRAALNRTKPRASRPYKAPATSGDYVMPPLELLDPPVPRAKRAAQETEANIGILENTLAQFRIQAQVVEIADGPSITRYEIRLGEGIRVKKILDLADNLAMSLAAMSVRVEAPIPGKAAIGIEVPKKHATKVTLRECLASSEARDLESKVGFVLGKDVADNVRCADLARMPHLLVAGATNSGKSVCLNALIASMLFRARPDELKMIMIDPKRVELTLFDGIPHLAHPVIKDVKQAAGILRWVLKEMDRRYDLFAHLMTRNIEGYNNKVGKDPEKRLPFLVVVIDELADLMMQQGPEVEQAICRLAQLARATGIHLVIATQRPSVDVITGLIKANVPSRIAFSVSSQIDSRTILDAKGAESLIGRGDMLFKPVDATKPIRIQGAFLSEGEVEQLVNHLKAQGRPEYIAESISVDHGNYGTESSEEVEDELFESAARFVVTTGHASTSMIQRKFKIGYTRAARLVDMMESRSIVGSLDGAKPREIMMSRDGLDGMFQKVRNSLYGGTDYAADDEDEDQIVEIELDATSPIRDPFVDD